MCIFFFFFFQAEDGIRDAQESRGLGDVYKRQLWDQRGRRLLLGRDRFGICPLYWTRQGDWLLFASEIKALLASGMAPARPDRRGIDHIFTFAALPEPVTCFEGVQLLRAGHYLDVIPG